LCNAFVRSFKEAADISRRLAQSLLVFHETDADEIIAVFAETDARRYGNFGLFQIASLENSRLPRDRNFSGIGAQHEHAGIRRGHVPTGAAEALDHHIPAFLVDARVSTMQSSGPFSAAAAATWIGVKAP
jgi:hypothetical protein